MSPNHCDECAAYLATDPDIHKHAIWHINLNEYLEDLARRVTNLEAFTRPIGGRYEGRHP